MNCILRFPLLFKRELQVFKKAFFDPRSIAVSLNLLKREIIALKAKEFFTCETQNTWYVTYSVYYGITKYISIRAFLKPISKTFTSDFSTENMVSFKEVWPWNEFERFVVFSTIRLKGEVNFFIRQFLEVFYFPSAFIDVIESC